MGPDKKALRMDFAMIGAFVAAVDGCALYTLKRVIKRPGPRLFWALIILCLPVLGALIFFFLRPRDPIKPLADDEKPGHDVEEVSPTASCSDEGASSPTTPTIIRHFAMQPIKTPEGTSPNTNFMYAPSS